MRRLFDIVTRTVRRPFGSWREFFEYLVFVCVSVAGVANASFVWVLIAGCILFLMSFSRYAQLYAKAGRLDREWRELAGLARARGIDRGWRYYARARTLPMVVAMKLWHDCVFLAGAFLFGHVARWLWF